jgi:hypothetical protein
MVPWQMLSLLLLLMTSECCCTQHAQRQLAVVCTAFATACEPAVHLRTGTYQLQTQQQARLQQQGQAQQASHEAGPAILWHLDDQSLLHPHAGCAALHSVLQHAVFEVHRHA